MTHVHPVASSRLGCSLCLDPFGQDATRFLLRCRTDLPRPASRSVYTTTRTRWRNKRFDAVQKATARTELTTLYPPSLTLPVVLSPPSATLYLQNTLARTAGSQDRLDPNFRKKNRVTEVRLTRLTPFPRLVPPQSRLAHPSLGTTPFPYVRHAVEDPQSESPVTSLPTNNSSLTSSPSPLRGSESPRLHSTRASDATRHSRRFAAALMARERCHCAKHLLPSHEPCPTL